MAFGEGRDLSVPILHPKLDDSLCIVDTRGSQRMLKPWEDGCTDRETRLGHNRCLVAVRLQWMDAGRTPKRGCISNERIDSPDDCKAYSAWEAFTGKWMFGHAKKTGKSMQWRVGEKRPIHTIKMHERLPP